MVETPEIRTADGLGVGSTLAELRARFGPMLIYQQQEVGIFAKRRNPYSPLSFRLDEQALILVRFAGDTAVASDSVPGDARVEAVEVWSANVRRLGR